MDEHFDLVAWLARRRRMLDGQKAKAMAEHLTACEKCRQLDELAAHLEAIALQNNQKGERKLPAAARRWKRWHCTFPVCCPSSRNAGWNNIWPGVIRAAMYWWK